MYMLRLDPTFSDSFHHTPLLVSNVVNPVRLAGRDQHVRAPAIDLPI